MIVQCKEEDVEKNGYTHTDTQTDTLTCQILTQPVQRLGWVKNVACLIKLGF